MHTTKNMKETETRTMTDRVPESLLGLSYYAVTDKGDRPYNEDAWGHASCGTLVTFVVSDGVGGQPGGDLASSMVVERVRQDAKAPRRSVPNKCGQATALLKTRCESTNPSIL